MAARCSGLLRLTGPSSTTSTLRQSWQATNRNLQNQLLGPGPEPSRADPAGAGSAQVLDRRVPQMVERLGVAS